MERAGLVARRLAWPVLFTVVVAAVFGFGVVPTRSYLDRRQQVAAAEERLAELERANAEARARRDQLLTDDEVEKRAREDHGLVKPGEESYTVLPPPSSPTEIPDVWPFERLGDRPG